MRYLALLGWCETDDALQQLFPMSSFNKNSSQLLHFLYIDDMVIPSCQGVRLERPQFVTSHSQEVQKANRHI
jgi:hypothetical protein